jgi:hypothetical protein
MISDDEVERAIDYMRDSADKDAQARAEAIYLSEWVKCERSRLTTEQTGISNAAARDVAESHPEYKAALDAYKAAVREDFRRRFLREAAAAKVAAWQTMSANNRAQRI